MKILVVSVILFSLVSCRESNKKDNNDPNEESNTAGTELSKTIDSISRFKPLQLAIDSVRSDMDQLIPLGYNETGSFAYFIDENHGGGSLVSFHITPVYQVFSVNSRFEMDMDLDTVLSSQSGFIYHSLSAGNIRLTNQFRKLSLDSLGISYGHKFDYRKTYGPADPDDASGKKLLTSALITYRRYEENTVEVVNKQLPAYTSIYDIYISDCLVVPNRDGDLGFLVVVTESRGFEGYVRKAVEVVPIGVLETKE